MLGLPLAGDAEALFHALLLGVLLRAEVERGALELDPSMADTSAPDYG